MNVFEEIPNLLFNYKTFWGCFFVSLVVALIATPLVIRLAIRFGVLDKPNLRKIHAQPMPLLGGMAIFLGMWVPVALLSLHNNVVTEWLNAGGWPSLAKVFLAGLAMLLLGVCDDKYGLSARVKFVVQVPVAICLVYFGGEHFDLVRLPFLGEVQLGVWGPVLSIVWIVGMTNALNLIDGIDGLAAGTAFFVAATTGLIAIVNNNLFLALIMWGMAGACLGFLFFNFNPARIFLGDTGSLFLGVTLAVSSIEANSKATVATSMLIPVLVLGYPALDTLLAMARRAIRGKPMFSGDKGHIHHRLLALGFGQRTSALILYGVCGLFCLVGIFSAMGNHLGVLLSVLALLVLTMLGLWLLGFMRYFTPQAMRERARYRVAYHYCEMTKQRIKLTRVREQVYDLMRDAAMELGLCSLKIGEPQGPVGLPYSREWRFDAWSGLDSGKEVRLGNDRPEITEPFAMPQTGLKVEWNYQPSSTTEEGDADLRLLLGEIFLTADMHLKNLAPVSDKALPAVQRGAVATGQA